MLELGSHPGLGFLAKLLRNFEDGSFPGGTFLCLQILAFWLSWARLLYCKDRQMRVSAKILDTLRAWAAAATDREGIVITVEETQLAQKLYDDFSRLPPADAPDTQQAGLEGLPADKTNLVANDPDLGLAEELDDLKEKGNQAFADCKFDAAIEQYSKAIALATLPVDEEKTSADDSTSLPGANFAP